MMTGAGHKNSAGQGNPAPRIDGLLVCACRIWCQGLGRVGLVALLVCGCASQGRSPGGFGSTWRLNRAQLQQTRATRICPGCDLARANLRAAKLTEAELAGARLTQANLSNAQLTNADLSRAWLMSADLTGADLTGADLTAANLGWANLTGADLTGASLTGARLTGVTWTDATICPDPSCGGKNN